MSFVEVKVICADLFGSGVIGVGVQGDKPVIFFCEDIYFEKLGRFTFAREGDVCLNFVVQKGMWCAIDEPCTTGIEYDFFGQSFQRCDFDISEDIKEEIERLAYDSQSYELY